MWIKVRLIALLLLIPWAAAQGETTLWRVESAPGNVFIGGSLHVLRSSDYPLPVEFERAYGATDTLVLELNAAAMDPVKTADIMLRNGMYLNGETLASRLAPETLDSLTGYLRRHNLPVASMVTTKPWLLVFTLVEAELTSLGVTPENGVDLYFNRKAVADGKRVIGLETFEEQVALLSGFGESNPDAMVAGTLDEMDRVSSFLEQIVLAWRVGREDALESMLTGPMERDYPSFYQRAVTERNRNWLPAIEAVIDAGENVLVIVGSGHLVGSDNLLDLLRQRGHRVEKFAVEPASGTRPAPARGASAD